MLSITPTIKKYNGDKATNKLMCRSVYLVNLDDICNSKVSPARVVGVHKNSFLINQGTEETLVTVAGRLNYKKDHNEFSAF